jgi:hypothetical protein
VISYEYLEKMFFRLREAQLIGASVAKDKKSSEAEKNICRAFECSIKASIRDYIRTHDAALLESKP